MLCVRACLLSGYSRFGRTVAIPHACSVSQLMLDERATAVLSVTCGRPEGVVSGMEVLHTAEL